MKLRGGMLALGVVAVLALTGCPAPPPSDATTDVDRQRIEIMKSDPVLAGMTVTDEHPGRVLNEDLGWDRGSVWATRVLHRPGDLPPIPDFVDVNREMGETVRRVRSSGWTVLYATCIPYDDVRDADPYHLTDYDGRIYAYRIRDGVSYWLMADMSASSKGGSRYSLQLVAPHHRDPDNLFPDQPTGLADGETCLEGDLPLSIVENGKPIRLLDRYGFPRRSRSPDPLHR